MGKRFEQQTVFITGASAGIGAALAREFARQGASVMLTARREDRLLEVQQDIEASGGMARICPCDVTSRASLDHAVANTLAAFGRIDIVIANAGFGVTGIFERLTTEDFRRQFETNFFGVVETLYATLPHLKSSRGRIGIVSSAMGKFGLPTGTPYSASKFALCGLGESLYFELLEHGVSLTMILPGLVESDIRRTDNQGRVHPDRPDPAPSWLVLPADRAARQIVRAMYRRAPEVIVTGHARLMIALSRHFPRFWRQIVRWSTVHRIDRVEKRRRGDLNR